MKVMSIIADIPVPDLERARDFYTDYLGLAEEEFSLGWVARLTQPDTRAGLQILTADATGPEDPIISVKVDDVEAAYREAGRASDRGAVHHRRDPQEHRHRIPQMDPPPSAGGLEGGVGFW